MIRLRRMLERGRAHPVIGPILLIVLVLVLAMVFLHAAHDGHEAATEIGGLCLAIVTFLGPVLIERFRRHVPAPLVRVRRDRGPPLRSGDTWIFRAAAAEAGWRLLPLRR